MIIPIDSANPKTCYGTQYNGSAYGTVGSIFNFDIPMSTQGKTCSIQFLFPDQSTLETSSYTYSGDGVFKFAMLNGPASCSTTFASSPKIVTDYGSFTMSPGNAYDIASIPCPAGKAIGIWLHTTGNGVLDYFQDYNPCREYPRWISLSHTNRDSQLSAFTWYRSDGNGAGSAGTCGILRDLANTAKKLVGVSDQVSCTKTSIIIQSAQLFLRSVSKAIKHSW